MSEQSPYDNISISEGGRFVRYEWDVNYITDEQLETLRKHVETLQTENAKLREELAKWERLAAGIDLPEYPVTQFKPKDLERENANLRELVRDMACEYECGYLTFPQWLVDRMRELGVDA